MADNAWRTQRPTVDEVRACAWWWRRFPSSEFETPRTPHVQRFYVFRDSDEVASEGDEGRNGEYAPCLPPPSSPPAPVPALVEMVKQDDVEGTKEGG